MNLYFCTRQVANKSKPYDKKWNAEMTFPRPAIKNWIALITSTSDLRAPSKHAYDTYTRYMLHVNWSYITEKWIKGSR